MTGVVPITKGQIKKIHALKNALALDDDIYRELLGISFHARSSKELSISQANKLIEHLESRAVAAGVWEKRENRSYPPQPPQGMKFDDLELRRGCMASPTQLRKIEAMWQEISMVEDPEGRKKALRHFIERIARVSDIRFLDMTGAQKVINGLNAMHRQTNHTATKIGTRA